MKINSLHFSDFTLVKFISLCKHRVALLVDIIHYIIIYCGKHVYFYVVVLNTSCYFIIYPILF